jgi:hypothetical protein
MKDGWQEVTGGSFYSIWTNNFYLQKKVFCEFQKADEKEEEWWNGWTKWMNLKFFKTCNQLDDEQIW